MAVDAAGNVYVADFSNHTIRKITPAGEVTTLAGTGSPGSTNATGTAAGFNNSFGVATDTAGNGYVADSGNHLIRKINSPHKQIVRLFERRLRRASNRVSQLGSRDVLRRWALLRSRVSAVATELDRVRRGLRRVLAIGGHGPRPRSSQDQRSP